METPEYETGPAEGLGVSADFQSLKLTANDKVVLANGVHSPFYGVLLKLAEGEIQKLETAHFKVWKEKEAFERTGLTAVAARLFFERLQAEFARQAEEFSSEVEFAKKEQSRAQTSPEDFVLNEFN